MHEGHKGRLREKARTILEDMPEHEVLEFLLNYCIVRKNTNDIAHDLLNKFGSLAGVLNAPYELLMQIDGMGEVSATFLTLLPSIFSRFKKSELAKVTQLKSYKDCVDYVSNCFEACKNEKIIVVCLDKRDNIIFNYEYSTKEIDSVEIKISDLVSKITAAKASKVLIAHNHLFAHSAPSSEDINFTKRVASTLSGIGVHFVDHIIVGKEDWFSFRNSEILTMG